jgi:hypothetical protein
MEEPFLPAPKDIDFKAIKLYNKLFCRSRYYKSPLPPLAKGGRGDYLEKSVGIRDDRN